MTKVTSSKKKPKLDHESNVVEQKKTTLKPKKMGSEIDEIFAGKKRKRLEKEKKGEAEKPAKVFAANTKSLDKTKIGKSSKTVRVTPLKKNHLQIALVDRGRKLQTGWLFIQKKSWV